MTDSLRGLRDQLIQTPPAAMQDGNQTTFRSNTFTQIYFKDTLIGGAQDMQNTETNNTVLQPQIGNDRLEFRPGMRSVNWSLTRYSIRGRTLRDVFGDLFPTVSDMDFRYLQIPVTIHQFQQSLDNSGDAVEDTHEDIVDAVITSYSSNISDPFGFRQEIINGIARGMRQGGLGGVPQLGPHSYLFGSFAGGISGQKLAGHARVRAS